MGVTGFDTMVRT